MKLVLAALILVPLAWSASTAHAQSATEAGISGLPSGTELAPPSQALESVARMAGQLGKAVKGRPKSTTTFTNDGPGLFADTNPPREVEKDTTKSSKAGTH